MTTRRTNTDRLALAGLVAVAATVPLIAFGSQVGALPTFQAGQPIRASDFNSAFQTLRTSVDDNNTRIGNLPSLMTTAKSDLVSAINEVRQAGVPGATGPQGPQGPQGPAGPTQVAVMAQTISTAPGGGTNAFTGNLAMTNSETILPSSLVAGKAFTATVRVQTANAAAGNDTPGPPLVAGNLVLDLRWFFQAGQGATATVTQAAVATIVLDAAVNNDKSVSISGTVPAAPTTPGGFQTTELGGNAVFGVAVNGATTAQGQGHVSIDMRITP